MQNQINISEMQTQELEAQAYRWILQRDQISAALQAAQQELAKRYAAQPVVAMEPVETNHQERKRERTLPK